MSKIVRVNLPAFCLDENVLQDFLETYGVKVIDRAQEPWNVVFEGPETGLREMMEEHWCYEEEAVNNILKDLK